MQKQNKRDLILRSIIEAYLGENAPIGSSELSARMSVAMPASTIRVYFKKLSDDGEITQLHISGGRIPTAGAMRGYWREIFNDSQIELEINDERNLKALCDKFELYCMIFGEFEQNLEEILNLNNKFLILNFSLDEIVLKYNSKVERFLKNLINIDINRLEAVCAQVGLSELRIKIRELKRGKIYFQENEILAFSMFDDERFKMIFEPSFVKYMQNVVTFAPLFKDSFMGLKFSAKYQNKPATMICAGSIYSDYVKFLNQIKEAA